MKYRDAESFCSSRHEKIRHLAAPLAAIREEALDLKRPAQMRRSGLDGIEGVERTDQSVPFSSVARRIADLEIGDGRACELSARGARFDHRAHLMAVEARHTYRD